MELSDNSSLLNIFTDYICLERGFAPNTCVAYRSNITKYITYLDNLGLNLKNVVHTTIRSYLIHLKSNNLSSRTISRHLSSIRAFHRFLLAESHLLTDPSEKTLLPKFTMHLPKVASLDEIRTVLNFMSKNNTSIVLIRMRAMLELMYATGMRVSELVHLKFSQLNRTAQVLKILGKGNKERMIPVHEVAMQAINDYLLKRAKEMKKNLSDYIFINKYGTCISRHEFWRQLNNLSEKSGLKIKLYPHLIRHSFASHLLSRGADLRSIQELLGHSSISTTQIYTHIDKKDIKAIYTQFHPQP